jgi:hypothetical protein
MQYREAKSPVPTKEIENGGQKTTGRAKMPCWATMALFLWPRDHNYGHGGPDRPALLGLGLIHHYLRRPVFVNALQLWRFLLPHLPLDRDTGRVNLGDEVGLQYYRLQRIYSGEIALGEGDPKGVKSPNPDHFESTWISRQPWWF